MTLLQEITESRKARLRRIEAAAWKPPAKPPEVTEPWFPPPVPVRDPIAELLAILAKGPSALPVDTYPHPRKIQRIVAAYYKLGMNELLSVRRCHQLVRARHIAMYLCKQLLPLSYPEIGRKFGKRDHTTVLHGVKKIAAQVESDPALVVEIEELKQLIGQVQTG